MAVNEGQGKMAGDLQQPGQRNLTSQFPKLTVSCEL
jgi:hypothetical protein